MTKNSIYLTALLHCISDGSKEDDIQHLFKPHIGSDATETENEDLIRKAAKLSAGSENSSLKENRRWTDAASRLQALTESIGGNASGHYFLPDTTLNIIKENFPKKDFRSKPDFSALKNGYIKELRAIGDKSDEAFSEVALTLLEKYAVHVPAFVDGDSDISLYDHAKTTAAIASCLFDLKQSGNAPQSSFLLVGADFSGIQNYIYQISSKYAAKSLKGRSFYLRILSDAVVRMLLRRLQINRANIVYNSGGGFYLLAPNTYAVKKEIEDCRKELEDKFFKAHGTTLYLALDYTELSEADLCHHDSEHSLSLVWSNLFKLRERRKFSKFASLLSKDYEKFFLPSQKTEPKFDAVTGEEITGNYHETTNDGVTLTLSELNYEQQKLGTALKNTKAIIISTHPLPSLKDMCFNMQPADLGSYYYFLDKKDLQHHTGSLKNCEIILLNGDETSNKFIDLSASDRSVSIGFDFYGGNQNNGKTFDQLCDFGHREFSRLGVLRMDVDNLGKIFQQGIPAEKASLNRFATLSRLFDFFFSGYLNTIYHETDPIHSQIIYSGGDDLFIVGSWDVMIDMAERIKKDFAEFTCFNPAFSISGGIAIVTAKFPIMNASKESESEEEKAKTHGSEKNSISMMGMALNWAKEYPAVKNLKCIIVNLLQKECISKSFLSKIQSLKNQAHIKIKQVGDKEIRQVTNYRVYWLLAYTLKRMILRNKPQIRSESVCSNQFNCYACVRHQIEANDALVMPL